jgi:hypothetical protein
LNNIDEEKIEVMINLKNNLKLTLFNKNDITLEKKIDIIRKINNLINLYYK